MSETPRELGTGIAWLIGIPLAIVVLVFSASALSFGAAFLIGAFLSGLPGGINFFLFLTFAGVFLYGVVRRKRGFQLAPLALCALWFLASVGNRAFVWLTEDRLLSAKPAMSHLAAERTVVDWSSERFGRRAATVLANGHVDQYVVRRPAAMRGKEDEFHAYVLGKGAECTPKELSLSSELAKVGRSDECFVERVLAGQPDGLILRITNGPQGSRLRIGEFISRYQGVESKAGEWRFRTRNVLSYVPLLGTAMAGSLNPQPSRNLWQFAARGPLQPVYVGAYFGGIEGMLEGVYGVGPDEPVRQRPMRLPPMP